MRSHIKFCVAMVCAAATVLVPRVGLGQPPDRTAADLATARANYETAMEVLRKDVGTAIDAKIIKASNPAKVDQDKLDEARAERAAFEREGKLPDVPATAQLTNRYAMLAAKMHNAYGLALAAYTKANNKVLADDVDGDSKLFISHWDLGPWHQVPESSLGRQKQVLTSAAPLTVALGLTGEYRLEVRGTRTTKSGKLIIQFPLANGQQLSVPAVVSERGEIRVLISVFKGYLSADAGVARPIDTSKAVDSQENNVTLTTDGAVTIDVLQAKPIVDGPPPEVQRVAANNRGQAGPGQAAAAPPAVEDLFPVGSKWDGTILRKVGSVKGTQSLAATVKKVVANQVTLQNDSGGIVVLNVNGNNLSVNEMHSSNGDAFTHVNLSGSVSNGQLSLAGGWIREGHGTGNGQQVTITLTRQ